MARLEEFDDVQLDVEFTQASSRSNLTSNENIAISFGKISKWYEALVPTGGSSGQFLGFNSSGTAKWVSNPNVDEKVKSTKISQSAAAAAYYPTLMSGETTAGVGIIDSAKINHTPGTTSTVGNTRLVLGNEINEGTSNNEQGLLRLWSSGTKYHTLKGEKITTDNVEHILPTIGGTILNTGTTSFTRTLTSGTKIGTIKINGTSSDIYAPTDTDTKVTQSSSTTSDFRPLLLGKNNQTNPENLETTVTDQTYVTKHVFVQPSTGNLTLYNASGDSPSLIFRRGTMIDNTLEWRIQNVGGKLNFDRDKNESTETWENIFQLDPSNNKLYFKNTEVSLSGHTHNYVPNTQAGMNTAINLLATGSSDPQLADYYISQYAGGGTTTTSYHRRPISALWNTFKSLITVGTTGTGNAVTSVSIGNDGNNRKITFTKGSTFLTSHQSVTDGNPTLSWGNQSTVATIGSTDIHVTMPTNPNTDTKVTSTANHYTPETVSGKDKTASASGATAAWSIDVVKGVTLNTDGKGHVTGMSVTSGKIPANPIPSYNVTGSAAWTVADRVLVTNAASGNVIKQSSYTIATSVPANALFTDTWTAMVGATSSANGSVGYVNAVPPKDGYNTKFLRADGSWAVPANTTYSAGTGLSLSGTTINHSATISADTTSSASPAHGGTFTVVDSVTRDATGHVTTLNTKTITLPSDQNTDTKVTQSSSTTSNYRPVMLGYTNTSTVEDLDATVTNQVYATTNLFLKPSSGYLYATAFSTAGYLTGAGAQLVTEGLYLKAYKVQADDSVLNYGRYAIRTYPGKTAVNPSSTAPNGAGMLVTIESGGLVIVGSGESAKNLADLISDDQSDANTDRTRLDVGGTLNTEFSGDTENLILSSDNSIYFLTNCNTIADRTPVVLNASSSFYPGTTGTGSIGTSSYRWNTAYINTIYENGTSLANKYAGISHTHTTTIATDSGTNQLTLSANTKYKLTAGGTEFIFTTPTDNDTKVTSSTNHYTPSTASGQDKSASASGATAAWSIDVVKGVTLNTDGKGHVTGISVTSGKIPANPVPSNNVTGSGTSGYLTKWNGANTITNGPQLGSSTTTYLNNAGNWATPPDTKNTAGSTDTSSKIYLIGATSQAANPQTYSDNEVFTTSGVLTTKKVQVGGGSCTMEYNSTTETLDFVFT